VSDVWQQLERYRHVKALPDGSRLLLRPLAKSDKEGLLDLFARASRQDLEYFRSDAADPSVVAQWVENLDLHRVFPLIAVVGDRVVGDATLHLGEHYHRHRAWVRIFLDRQYRRQGIGTLMLRCLDDIARRLGLQQLYAETLMNQPQVIKAFEELGYQHEATLRDYFITGSGETLDVAILVLRIVDRTGAF
jgi:RimJ/RimL family protein N-acetyltransferase